MSKALLKQNITLGQMLSWIDFVTGEAMMGHRSLQAVHGWLLLFLSLA